MSNWSVIDNLEKELDLYRDGQFSRDRIAKRFGDHIEALEGIPYSVILEARRFERGLEMDGIYFEEGSESKSDEIHDEIKIWLNEIRKKYCNG